MSSSLQENYEIFLMYANVKQTSRGKEQQDR